MPGQIPAGIEVKCSKCARSSLFDPDYVSLGLTAETKLAHLVAMGTPMGWIFEDRGTDLAAVCPLCQAKPFSPASKCPKCGHDVVTTAFCAGSVTPQNSRGEVPAGKCERGIGGEHLHRTCGRCGFVWVEKCLEAK